MYSGAPFSDEIKEFLIDTARHMSRNQIERQPFKSEAYEGEIRTKFTPYFVSTSLAGILFTANLECEAGTTLVRFLVTPRQLKKRVKGKWSPWYRITTTHPRDNAANN
jgi:hypothetical protein